ncbi:hypothetical protein BURCENBC7_AP3071 [Burkholderia cenocepacia BC7]|nr:uncharacterized protein BCN122_II1205 [Burkholderia cenocepacia]EPZ89057.1 hypothetical protein BURCENK562V_C3228 [Burkholderia cenocepacia K56-2Valvano]ERI28907.1 hypothetical protein BURCENBC7_AP3071 [Burkholderia cenocepacia BC7]
MFAHGLSPIVQLTERLVPDAIGWEKPVKSFRPLAGNVE